MVFKDKYNLCKQCSKFLNTHLIDGQLSRKYCTKKYGWDEKRDYKRRWDHVVFLRKIGKLKLVSPKNISLIEKL